MCQRVRCPKCGKPTFAGCGRHVEQVLGDVPPDERCQCRQEAPKNARGPTEAPSFFRRLFDR